MCVCVYGYTCVCVYGYTYVRAILGHNPPTGKTSILLSRPVFSTSVLRDTVRCAVENYQLVCLCDQSPGTELFQSKSLFEQYSTFSVKKTHTFLAVRYFSQFKKLSLAQKSLKNTGLGLSLKTNFAVFFLILSKSAKINLACRLINR